MKIYVCVTVMAAILGIGCLHAQESIVSINGTKYLLHVVVKGDTLYSLSKKYGVGIDDIISANQISNDGIKTNQTLKIPYNASENFDDKSMSEQFDIHLVDKGETIYSISRKYSMPVSTLINDNENIDPTHLSVGTKLYIRKTKNEQSDIVADDFVYHVIHSGETVADIADRFGTTERQILALNGMNESSECRAGRLIKIPKIRISYSDNVKESRQISFRSLESGDSARVSLLLPLTVNGKTSSNYTDFYRGFLIGLDKVRRNGHSVCLKLFNTGHNYDNVKTLVDNGSLDNSDLIVGPIYEDMMFPVAEFAEENSIPVVSPLANLSKIQSNAVFQMSPDYNTKYDKVRNLFNGSKRIVFIYSDHTDSEFEAEMLKLAGNIPYRRHKYSYEHPSVVERRLKSGEASGGPSDLSPLLQESGESVFVIMSDNETDVDRILAALASAKISLVARSRNVTPFQIIGNNKWNRYHNIDRSVFFSNNVIMLSSYHAGRDNEKIKDFDGLYASAFNAIPSLYSYRGYDAAVIFTEALYSGIDFGSSGITPLQTPYRFGNNNDSTRLNMEWVRINYNNDFTITTE